MIFAFRAVIVAFTAGLSDAWSRGFSLVDEKSILAGCAESRGIVAGKAASVASFACMGLIEELGGVTGETVGSGGFAGLAVGVTMINTFAGGCFEVLIGGTGEAFFGGFMAGSTGCVAFHALEFGVDEFVISVTFGTVSGFVFAFLAVSIAFV